MCWQIGCQIPYGKKMWKQYLMVPASPYFCSSKRLGNQIIRIEYPAADIAQEMYLLELMSCENHTGPIGVNQTFRAVSYNALQCLEGTSFWTSKKKRNCNCTCRESVSLALSCTSMWVLVCLYPGLCAQHSQTVTSTLRHIYIKNRTIYIVCVSVYVYMHIYVSIHVCVYIYYACAGIKNFKQENNVWEIQKRNPLFIW